ncbi:MAG: glycosyltransferase family 2 protein [Sphingorhabdus sp.]
MPQVDVLIPAYNAQSTICGAVESIQHQTLDDIRIVIVDDGSTDGTAALLRDMAESDNRIVVLSKANGGIVDALNDGLALCDAEFIARHDADDIAYPERLAVQIAYLRKHPEVAAVGTAVRHIDGQGRHLGSIARLRPPDEADCHAIPAREPYIIHPFLTLRRSAIMAVGGYRYASHAEDSDLYWRLTEHFRMVNLPDLLGEYRIHDESISGSSILNGRIQAIGSQLAALSAQRRRIGKPDLVFAKNGLASLKDIGRLDAMIDAVTIGFDPYERRWIEEAVAAKLLELTAYRPYELDADDCAFIGTVAERSLSRLQDENRAHYSRMVSGCAARIASKHRLRDAIRLIPPTLYPSFTMRYAARMIMPERLRRSLRNASNGHVSNVK